MGTDALTNDERRQLLLSVGTHRGRRPLSPFEVAGLFEKAISRGATLGECAAAASLEGTTWVSRFLRLLKLPSTVTHLIDWGGGSGTIGLSNASEIARLEDGGDEEKVIRSVLANRLNVSEVRQVIQLRKRSNRLIDACLEEVLKLRPHIEKRYLLIGAITNAMVKDKLAPMTQHQRDEVLIRVMAKYEKGFALSVRKLGLERFTLVGDDRFGKFISDKKDILEQEINDAVLGEIQ
jgi:hypothetical protein